MQYFGFDRPSFALRTLGFGVSAVNPDDAILALFAGGKQGVWYDPSDKSSLFQDAAGTVPVTKDGDPVALMRDKSGNGNHATVTVSTARPVYKTDGILHWLGTDGTDDFMASQDFGMGQPLSVFAAARADGSDNVIMDGLSGNTARLRVHSSVGYQLYAGASISDVNNYVGKTKVYNAVINGSNSSINIAGNTPITGNAGTLVGGGITLFSTAINTIKMQGSFYGLVVVSELLTTLERLMVNTYLADKAGVTL